MFLARILPVYLSSNKGVTLRLYAVYNMTCRPLSTVVWQCVSIGLWRRKKM